jgi:hypothetical protein
LVYLDGFYKYETLNNDEPSIGYRVVSDYNFYLDYADSTINHFQLHYNKVIKLDGTEYKFYDVRLHYQSFVFSRAFGHLQTGFMIDNAYTHFKEELLIQPVLGNFYDIIWV